MDNIIWKGNHIEVEPPKRPKKITGTRFAAILGLNPWSTPFEVWCAVTRTYEKPFEDTIYTIAGKTIEPKQIEYMRKAYAMDNLVTPTDAYGKDYFKKTYGDFYPDTPIFGGMWDSLLVDDKGKPETVLEFKTTNPKKVEEWGTITRPQIPTYYALQAALYAYLLDIDDVIMIPSFLKTNDYDHPDEFKPSAGNTNTIMFKLSELFPDFLSNIEYVKAWWEKYVVTGISPDFDPENKVDAEILKALQVNAVPADAELETLVDEAEKLKVKLDKAKNEIADDEKRYDTLTKEIKTQLMARFRDGDKKVTMNGKAFNWEVSRSDSLKVNEEALKKDGLLDKYKTKVSTVYKITVKAQKT